MTIHRVRVAGLPDAFSVECDECGECHDLAAENFMAATTEIRQIPWVTRKEGGTWLHLCSCSTPELPPEESEEDRYRRYVGNRDPS